MSSGFERRPVEPDNATIDDLASVAPCTLRCEDGVVSIGGVPVADIIAEYGTALFIYDEEHLRRQLRTYKEEFASRYPDSSIIYAAKSFCCVAMDRIVDEEGCCIDIASGGELAFAQTADFPSEKLFIQGNNKTSEEIEEAIESHAAYFVVDTLDELDRISEAAEKRGIRQKVILRICPGIEADTHAYIQTANEDSKFGFNINNGSARIATEHALDRQGIELCGYHFHIGSQIFALDCFAHATQIAFDFMDEMRSDFHFVARDLDVGGGLGIAYLKDDHPATIAEFAEVVTTAVISEAEKHDYPLPHLYTEPGRSISANAALTAYTVGAVKKVTGVGTYVSVDGGMSDNIRTALYQADYEAFVLEHAEEPRSMVCDIVGKHCESGDVVVFNRSLQPCKAGEHVCVLATGAYCHEQANNYNKQVRPGVVMVADGTVREVVRRETYEDLLSREVG